MHRNDTVRQKSVLQRIVTLSSAKRTQQLDPLVNRFLSEVDVRSFLVNSVLWR